MKRAYVQLMAASIACVLLSHQLWAQSVWDAAKYSQASIFATARSTGFGGALGSVGGDFSSLSVNPAGIGIYRTS